MFPHTITIFNITSGQDDNIIYNRQVIKDVFWYDKTIISPEDNGEKLTSVYNVILSDKALEKYLEPKDYLLAKDKSNNFTLQENDIVVLGEFPKITDLKDVQLSSEKYFLIKTISDNRWGSLDLQNMEITN